MRLLHPVKHVYWLWRRIRFKRSIGVRGLVVNSQQQICLVRHTYTSGWFLPGGGVKPGESIPHGLRRELYEEAGIVPEQDPVLLGVYYQYVHGVDDYITLYLIKNFTQQPKRSLEIAETGWYHWQDLPPGTTKATQRRVQEYFNHTAINEHW